MEDVNRTYVDDLLNLDGHSNITIEVKNSRLGAALICWNFALEGKFTIFVDSCFSQF